MLESEVEKSLVKAVKQKKGIAYKFVSPSKIGVPDRLVLLPIPERYQRLVAKYVRFVECKAPGKKPRASQLREHKRIRDLGLVVDVLDQKIDVK